VGCGPEVTCDLSIEQISGTEPDAVAGFLFGSDKHRAALADLVARQTATRNRLDGWWVAAADPDAAQHAHTQSYPRSAMRRASAFTDGATRPVDQMRCYDWSAYLDLLDKVGPAGLIEHVRTIERADPTVSASHERSGTMMPRLCSSRPTATPDWVRITCTIPGHDTPEPLRTCVLSSEHD
jgi:hypothetical protein